MGAKHLVRQLAAKQLAAEYWRLVQEYPEISTDGFIHAREATPVELTDFIHARLFLNARGTSGGDLLLDRAPLSFKGQPLTRGALLLAGLAAGFSLTYEGGHGRLISGGHTWPA